MHTIFSRSLYIICKNKNHIVKSFLKYGHLLKDINKVHLTLISKKDDPDSFLHYRSIKPCNVSSLIKKWILYPLHIHVCSGTRTLFSFGAFFMAPLELE